MKAMLTLRKLANLIRMGGISRMEARTTQLNEAANMLERHYRDLQVFLNDEDAPDLLSRLLLDISDAVTDPDAAARAFLVDGRDGYLKVGPEVGRVQAALDELRIVREDLIGAFERSVRAALVAALLFNNRTAAEFSSLERDIVSGHENELAAAVALVRAAARIGDTDIAA